MEKVDKEKKPSTINKHDNPPLVNHPWAQEKMMPWQINKSMVGTYFGWDGTYLGVYGNGNNIYRTSPVLFAEIHEGSQTAFRKYVGKKDDFIAMIATVHAETFSGADGATYNERRGIAHAVLNKNNGSVDGLKAVAEKISNIFSDGNPRANQILKKSLSQLNLTDDIKSSVKAVLHVMAKTDGEDNSMGATSWDGLKDLKAQYDNRATYKKEKRYNKFNVGYKLNHIVKGVQTVKGTHGYYYSSTAIVGKTIFATENN